VASLALALSACGGRSQDGNPDEPTATAGSPNGGSPVGFGGGGAGTHADAGRGHPALGGSAGRPSETQAGAAGRGREPLDCDAPTPPPSSLRRLSRFEFNNTVRDLFGDVARPADFLTDALPLRRAERDSTWPEGHHDYAHDFALRATADDAKVRSIIACDVAAEGEAVCRQRFLEHVVSAVFRQTVEPGTVAELDDVFAAGQELGGNFASGVRAVLEVALQSPEFIYHVELGEPLEAAADPTLGRPSSREMASRLSFLLLGSVPDTALRTAADRDALRTREQVEAQARRLLEEPRAREVLTHFHLQLLDIRSSGELEERLTPPGFGDVSRLALEETSRFVEDVAWSGAGGFEQLWTSPVSWINDRLALFYGVEGVTGSAFRSLSVNPSQRAGLLTQASFLASSARDRESSPVQRGVQIATRLLCQSLLPPPPEVPATLPLPPLNATTRQRYEQAINADASCMECHRNIDPLGFAFEHYDGLGRWRDEEHGQPIDARGELLKTDAAGAFNGALELSALLAKSQDAKSCYAGMWLAYAYGREEEPEDACSRRSLEDAFTRSDGDIVELVVSLTQTDGFLYRKIEGGGP
jgi:hypothetical protein